MDKLPFHQWLEIVHQELDSRGLTADKTDIPEDVWKGFWQDGYEPEEAVDSHYESLQE